MNSTSVKGHRSRVVLHTRVVSGRGGGPEKTILNSDRFLKDYGYSILCAYMRDPHDSGFREIQRRAEARGVALLPVDDSGPLDWKVAGRLRKICGQYQPAIWHGHDYKSNMLALGMPNGRAMKRVSTVHGWVKRTWKTPLYYLIDRLSLRFFDSVICVSEELRDQCLASGIAPQLCLYVPNGVDTEEYQRLRSSNGAKAVSGISSTRLVVGVVGRLSSEKSLPTLMRAIHRLVNSGLDIELWIVGDGDQRRKLRTVAEDLEITDNVSFLGYSSELVPLYEAMDIFALSSIREGLPNALLEAMAMELPTVCTRVSGVPSVIEDGTNGLLVEPNSVDSLADGIGRLARDSDLREQLGTAARKTIERSFSFASRMERIRDIYDSLLAE